MSAIDRNNVKVSGRGERAMMFAHGFGCDQNMWRFVAPAFEDDFTVACSTMSAPAAPTFRPTIRPNTPRSTAMPTTWSRSAASLGLSDGVFVGHSVSAMIGVLAAHAGAGAVRQPGAGRPVAALHRRRGTMSAASARRRSRNCWSFSTTTTWAGRRPWRPTIMGNADRPELARS